MPTGVYRAEWRAGEGRLRVLLQWDACEGDDGGEAAGGEPVAGGEATHFALLINADRPPDLSRLDNARRCSPSPNPNPSPKNARRSAVCPPPLPVPSAAPPAFRSDPYPLYEPVSPARRHTTTTTIVANPNPNPNPNPYPNPNPNPNPSPSPNLNQVAKLALALETGFEHPATFLFHVGEKLVSHPDPDPGPNLTPTLSPIPRRREAGQSP